MFFLAGLIVFQNLRAVPFKSVCGGGGGGGEERNIF